MLETSALFIRDRHCHRVFVLAATIGGAITIPINARAIKISCIIFILILRPAVLPVLKSGGYALGWPSYSASRLKTPPRRLPPCLSSLVSMHLENDSAICLLVHHRQDERNLEIPRKPAASATVLYLLRLQRLTKDFYIRIQINSFLSRTSVTWRTNAACSCSLHLYRTALRFCARHFAPSQAR